MCYYSYKGAHLMSLTPLDGLGPPITPVTEGRLFTPVPGDAALNGGSFHIDHPGQLLTPHGLEMLDVFRLTETEVDDPTLAIVTEGRLTAVDTSRPGWEELPTAVPKSSKRRVNLLVIGDVGSTLLTGLKLPGRDVISSIGICDLSDQITTHQGFETDQAMLLWGYDALPGVKIVFPDHTLDCGVFVFVASRGIPPVGSQIKDVRMARFETSASIMEHYVRVARDVRFQGLWCAVSGPVDPLAKAAYLESNRDEPDVRDNKSLCPEQTQGFGLDVMSVQAAYYARWDTQLSSFLSEGRSFGPRDAGLFITNSIQSYDEMLSQELTHLTMTTNLGMRELGFKPYVAPALSSGALSLLLALRREWHYGPVFLDGIYTGTKNRFTTTSIETELLPHMLDALFDYIREAMQYLKEAL